MAQNFRGVIFSDDSFTKLTPIYKLAYNPKSFLHSEQLEEHAFVGNCYVEAYEKELASRFYGCPFAWAGNFGKTFFGQDTYVGAKERTRSLPKQDYHAHADRSRWLYLVNFDRKEYIRIPELTDVPKYHPLPLLCANGLVEGDYNGTNEDKIGRWAYNRIGVDMDVPEGFTELDFTFETKE